MSDPVDFKNSSSETTTIDTLFCRAARDILLLAGDLADCRATAELFGHVERLVDSLPMATDEYALATCRLKNSRDYHRPRGGCLVLSVNLILHRTYIILLWNREFRHRFSVRQLSRTVK